MFESRDEVIRVSDHDYVARGAMLSPLPDPQVEDVMQVDVCQQWRGHCSLRGSYFRLRPVPVLGDPGPQPLADEAQDSPVSDAMLDELDQPFVGKIVEEATNVGIEYPVHLLPHNSDPQRIQGLVLTAPGPESIGEPQKVLFVNLVEDRHHRSLDQLILQGCDAQGTLPPIRCRPSAFGM